MNNIDDPVLRALVARVNSTSYIADADPADKKPRRDRTADKLVADVRRLSPEQAAKILEAMG